METSKDIIKNILLNGTAEEKRAVFQFGDDTPEKIAFKFGLFARTLYPRYFKVKSADFHKKMILNYTKSYLGMQNYNVTGFRGCSKTSVKKLFDAFVILNDTRKNKRKYIKVNSKDLKNSKQIVTDVYNLIVEAFPVYGDIFEREGDKKREETMASFTTKDSVKYTAGTVGQTQRGHVQDAYRPDWLWFEDIEDRDSISSQVTTDSIIAKCDEAIQGMSTDGTFILTANYISDGGSVQWFMDKKNIITDIIPILDANEQPTWPEAYDLAKIEQIKQDALDWAGEYLCDPKRSGDRFFNVLRDTGIPPIEIIGDWHIFKKFDPSHVYGMGADTSDGIGRDAQTATIFDFYTGYTVATYICNTIPPDVFAHELKRMANVYGGCIIAPENNQKATIIELKKIYSNIYAPIKAWSSNENYSTNLGWNTNSNTKNPMLWDFQRDYNSGKIKVLDKRLIAEMKGYTKNDLQIVTAGLQTRHFDLLMSAGIAWQMKNEASINDTEEFIEMEMNENI